MNTHYTQEMLVTSSHFMSHMNVQYMCGVATVDADNEFTDRILYTVPLETPNEQMMNRYVHIKYAMITDSIYVTI